MLYSYIPILTGLSLICLLYIKNYVLKFEVGLSPTPSSVKCKSLFVFRILDVLEIALGQSETLLHRRHVRI